MAMRFEGTRKRTLPNLKYPQIGGVIPWVTAAKILRGKRRSGTIQATQKEFIQGLAEEMPRWGHSHVPKE